jgi:hypothetical protein
MYRTVSPSRQFTSLYVRGGREALYVPSWHPLSAWSRSAETLWAQASRMGHTGQLPLCPKWRHSSGGQCRLFEPVSGVMDTIIKQEVPERISYKQFMHYLHKVHNMRAKCGDRLFDRIFSFNGFWWNLVLGGLHQKLAVAFNFVL